MSPYVAGGLLAAFIAWSGFMYHEGASKESAVCAQADAKHDLVQANVTMTAQQAVIHTVVQQQDVSQEVDHAFQLKENDIDSQYADDVSLYPIPATAAGHSMPAAASAACRPDAAASQSFRTRVYKLSPQECDENTNRLYGLQDWERKQIMAAHAGKR